MNRSHRRNLLWKKQGTGCLHQEKIFKKYNSKYTSNPWYPGLANTFLNSKDFYDVSDTKLFSAFRKIRDLGCFPKDIFKTNDIVFPKEMLSCGWTNYPNLEDPDLTTGVGLRRIKNKKSFCKKGGKFKLEALPKFKEHPPIEDCITQSVNYNIKCSINLPRWAGVRSDIAPVKNLRTKPKDLKEQKRINCWQNIPFTIDFFHNTRHFEINNYNIFELLKTSKDNLSCDKYINAKYSMLHNFQVTQRNCTCEICQKATKSRRIVDSTTNWMGYTNGEIGIDKLGDIISIFTANEKYQEYYSVDDKTKAVVIKQLPLTQKVIIGINGVPAKHTLQDFTLQSEVHALDPFSENPEYNKRGREVVEVAPVCYLKQPLSWEDQLTMPGVKILIGTGKDIQRPYEINQMNVNAAENEAFTLKKYEHKYPKISDRSILEVRDWFSFCKLTRSLIRSTPQFTRLVTRDAMKAGLIDQPYRIYDAIFQGFKEQLNDRS